VSQCASRAENKDEKVVVFFSCFFDDKYFSRETLHSHGTSVIFLLLQKGFLVSSFGCGGNQEEYPLKEMLVQKLTNICK